MKSRFEGKEIIYLIFIGGLLFIINTGGVLFLILKDSGKTAYVEQVKVYNNFILTKKLSTRFQNFTSIRKKEIDSLRISYEGMIRKYSEKAPSQKELSEIKDLKNKIIDREEKFENERNELYRAFENRVWTQINAYIAEYGEKKGYDFILGASGTGSLMYAAHGKDITSEIIEYINQNYQLREL